MMVPELLDRLASLGVRVEVVENKLRLVNGAKLPPKLVDTVRQHKAEVMTLLLGHDGPIPTMSDLDFPQGYRGLPQEPVALGLKVVDALGQTAPVLRKLNVLGFLTPWLLGRFQNTTTGAFDDPEIAALYRTIREEQVRLLALQDQANGGREA